MIACTPVESRRQFQKGLNPMGIQRILSDVPYSLLCNACLGHFKAAPRHHAMSHATNHELWFRLIDFARQDQHLLRCLKSALILSTIIHMIIQSESHSKGMSSYLRLHHRKTLNSSLSFLNGFNPYVNCGKKFAGVLWGGWEHLSLLLGSFIGLLPTISPYKNEHCGRDSSASMTK